MYHCTQGHYHQLVSTKEASQPSIQGSILALVSSEEAGKLNHLTETMGGTTSCDLLFLVTHEGFDAVETENVCVICVHLPSDFSELLISVMLASSTDTCASEAS